MSSFVVILGAGASADFGIPTLSTIFKDPSARQYLLGNAKLKKLLEDVFWGPRGLNVETSDQGLTIEDMLTLLRDWAQDPSLGVSLPTETLLRFRQSLYQLIFRAVFYGKSTRGRHLNPLIEILEASFDSVTWVSFNWDCVFESSYWYVRHQNPKVVVPLNNWYNAPGAKSTFLKLHGSVGWWEINKTLTYFPFSGTGSLSKRWEAYTAADDGRPVILEPSYYKYSDDCYKLLETQWPVCLERTTEADGVLVVGYSLPDGDARARSTLLTSFIRSKPTQIWSVLDTSQNTIDRYRRLFGTTRLGTLKSTLSGFNTDPGAYLSQMLPNLKFNVPPTPQTPP